MKWKLFSIKYASTSELKASPVSLFSLFGFIFGIKCRFVHREERQNDVILNWGTSRGEKKELVPERQVRNLWSRQIYTNTNFYTRIMSISEGESQTYCCSNQTSDFDIARDFCRKYGKELASAAPDVFNMLTWHQYRPFHGVILFYFKVFTPKC